MHSPVQVESAKTSHAKALESKETALRAASARSKDLLELLTKSRRCIVDALRARGRKAEVLAVATAAAALVVPGAHAYVAQLRTTAEAATDADPALAAAAAALGNSDGTSEGPLQDALMALQPGFLRSPLSGPLGAAPDDARPVFEELQAALTLK